MEKKWIDRIDKFNQIDLFGISLYLLMITSLIVFSQDVNSIPKLSLVFVFMLTFFLHNGLMKIAKAIKELKN